MCLGAGLLAGAGAGAGAAAGAGLGFGAAASAGSALGFGASAAALAAPAISFAAPAALSFGAAAALPSLGLSTISPLAISPFSAPLTGATGLFGLGSATKPFLLGQALNLGTNIFSTLKQRSAIFQQVRGIYDSSLRLIANAEQAKIDQQNAINDLLKAKQKSDKQKIMTAKIRSDQARGALIATERSGNTMQLLLQDEENKAANIVESIKQTMETRISQAIRDKNVADNRRDTVTNQAIDQINKATNAANQAPTLFGAITKSLGSGLTSYATLTA